MRMRVRSSAALVAAALLSAASSVQAHHSFAAFFDRNQPIHLTGTVTKVEWMNPHTWFYIDVAGKDGRIENWGFEMGSPNSLVRRGWSSDSLHVGDAVTIDGVLAKSLAHTGAVRTITLANGKKLFGAQNESK